MRRVILICIAAALWLSASLSVVAEDGPDGRVRVVDGDSLVVGDVRVRLFGIDAHELGQMCTRANGRQFDCGAWAKATVSKAIDGAFARCSTLRYDRYDRALATCEIGGEDLGAALLKGGIVAVYPNETLRDYPDYEKEAKLLERGIWGWSSESPQAFRAARRTQSRPGPTPTDGACLIKGNISGSGKIYHRPGQENYAQTSINPEKGERWFCSEEDAQNAGWRAARR